MDLDRNSSVFVRMALWAVAVSLFAGIAPGKAATPDELAKQIERRFQASKGGS